MADKAILRINEAMDKYTIEKVDFFSLSFPIPYPSLTYVALFFFSFITQDMATFVKKKCDEEFGGTWHCVIGRNFGCSITHDTKFVLFVQLDLMHALIFKSHE
jgi:dynein light chain LC8-type